MLGALAIVIAVLIVLNAQDKKDRQAPPPTVTNTITETTPFQSPSAMPRWTDEGTVGRGGLQTGETQLDAMALPAKVQVTPWATEPGGRQHTVSEQTWQ